MDAESPKPESLRKANTPKLVSALAAAARASNSIPLSTSKKAVEKDNNNSDDDDDSSVEEDFDEFAYQWTFPKFSSGICEARSMVLKVLGECLHAHDDHFDENALEKINVEFDWDDQEAIVTSDSGVGLNIWNECFDCQESLLDKVERYLQDKMKQDPDATFSTLKQDQSRGRAGGGGLSRVISNTVDMEKPQSTFQFEYDNSRTDIWVPPNMNQADLPEPIQGHGLGIRGYTNNTDEDILAPSMHYPHPFQKNIESFQYTAEQLALADESQLDVKQNEQNTLMKPMNPKETCHFVDTETQLSQLSEQISTYSITLMGVDLEHHSYRSFHGFTSLMQISIRSPEKDKSYTTQTYIIDTIQLRPHIYKYLSPFFHSPEIVKVMHGANSDVKWLQRDFGIYIVNLFDTSIASRLLKLPSASLAYLLKKYAGLAEIDTWKLKYQLGDWRVRPLSEGMLLYAMGDTHYLLDIYDVLKVELVKKGGGGNNDEITTTKEDGTTELPRVISIQSVLDASRKISLTRYTKEPFYPNGYERLLSNRSGNSKRSRVQSRFTPSQKALLASLWDWRDTTARELDESVPYICNDKALMRIAMVMPQSVKVLQGLWNPMPVIIVRHAHLILDLVKRAKTEVSSDQMNKTSISSGGKATAAESNRNSQSNKREKEDTQSHLFFNIVEEEVDDEDDQPNRFLEISACNSNFFSSHYTNHSIEMGKITRDDDRQFCRSQTVDGLGAARISFLETQEGQNPLQQLDQSVEMQMKQAQISAGKVRRNLAVVKKWNHNVWGQGDILKKDKNNGNNPNKPDKTDTTSGKDEMPKSLREAYSQQKTKKRDDLSPNATTPAKPKKRRKTEEYDEIKSASAASPGTGNKNTKTPLVPFDYSNSKAIDLFDTTTSSAQSSNPFFTGAARSLTPTSTILNKGQQASLTKGKGKPTIHEKSGKKGQGDKNSKSSKTERPTRRDPNRMHVYKPS